MSGHSKWATIKRQKSANDAKRGQVFTKLGNAIAIAARNGADPDSNFALRLAIDKAKAANMPGANIERSIQRGSGQLGGDQIVELTYEGYGPGGVAIIVEAATDNKNRTSSDVRTAFSKHGGRLAESGAVAYQFERKGVIRLRTAGDSEDMLMAVLEAGADDAFEETNEMVVYTNPKSLASVRAKLKEDYEVVEADLAYVPRTTLKIEDPATADKIVRLLEALDDLDDVTNTYTNFDT